MTEKHVHHHEGRGLEKTRHVLQQTSANASSSDLFLIRIGFRGLKTKFGKDFYFRTAASGLIFFYFFLSSFQGSSFSFLGIRFPFLLLVVGLARFLVLCCLSSLFLFCLQRRCLHLLVVSQMKSASFTVVMAQHHRHR